jgi:hypothetical protein
MQIAGLYWSGAARETRQSMAARLIGMQWPDGSWYVRSRAPKFQPYFQSGFPFDHDQWISSSATAWAIRALAPVVGETATGN